MKKSFALIYDHVMAPLEKRFLMKCRSRLLQHTSGNILEIGAGTGVNFPCKVFAVEPNSHMLQKAQKNAEEAAIPVNITVGIC
ncbi:hypothetical protein CVD28_07695 [Bacillus sp. M6-12]|uniref:class I SAM-dependent methyltransferase n=1 Tax=Bacillus sp. M6-12 TaxID=2054166 RepID=UPI000C7740C4|nr:class I SAM-dependent methyltransferase [Bacillus sp. M6-12]PLS18165.1 hypothetical protein CVD28_07695 [Bacillus sp. M6-12]